MNHRSQAIASIPPDYGHCRRCRRGKDASFVRDRTIVRCIDGCVMPLVMTAPALSCFDEPDAPLP
jgi:hypothetical protein